MESDLVSKIIELGKAKGSNLYLLHESKAEEAILKLAKCFEFDLSRCYLWENLENSEETHYQDNFDFWKPEITKRLAFFDDFIFLTITHDGFYPWPVFYCKKTELIDLLESLEYFEYFLFDKSFKQILFDTHENKLIYLLNK